MNDIETKIMWNKRPDVVCRTCMLMITHSCNLNCRYCYEPFKSNKMMSADVAKKIIQQEAEIVRCQPKYCGLEIDLMGGEPMTNFSLIKELVEWAETGVIGVPFIFFLTTNATLFDENKKRWFRKHKHTIVAGVSYDGTPRMQVANRSTENYEIDKDFFHSTWPFQEFHMTISRETLPFLAEGILELQRKGYPLSAVLAQGEDWQDSDARIYDEQLHKLIDAYISEPNLPPINLMNSELNVMCSNEALSLKQEKWCGSGTYMVTYDVDGKKYGCHLFTPVVLGEKAAELEKINFSCVEAQEDLYCSECVLKLVCPTCAGFNYRYRGDIAKRDHRWCKMVFVQIRSACEYQIRAIAKHLSNFEEQDAVIAEKALIAYPILSGIDLNKQHGPFIFYKK